MNFAIDTICKYNYCGYKTRKEPSKKIQIIYFDKYFEKEYDGAKSTGETVMRKILVLGHVDHGKTTFIRALNSVLYNRFGIGDEAGLIREQVVTAKKSFTFVVGGESYQYMDYPGFADYIDMFEAGEEKFDAALMICAATDGPMSQTRELARMAKEKGIDKLVLFLSKVDIVDDDELVELVGFGAVEVLAEEGYDESMPMIAGSADRAMMNPMGEHGDKIVEVIKAMAGLFD